MKKKWIGVLLVAMFLLLTNSVLAERWHLNLGGGYGIYNVSWGKINEFNQSFENWTRAQGLDDFKIGKLKNTTSSYYVARKLETAKQWEIGLDINGLYSSLSGSAEKFGEEKSMEANYDFSGGMLFVDLIDYYKFNPGKRFSPFVGCGIGSYFVGVTGNYYIWESTPPYRYLYEPFSASGLTTGYVLAAGADWMAIKSVFDIRIGLEVRYHWLQKIKGEFHDVENEGFSTLPVEPEPFEINPSGFQFRIYTFTRF